MLGEQIGEERGKVMGVKVLSSELQAPKMEISIQSNGQIFGVDYTSNVTYWAEVRSGGALYGEAKGILTTKDGETITFNAQGAGKPAGQGAAAKWRGAIYYHTTSEKLARLNGLCVIFEYDVDEVGNSEGKFFEWR